MDWKRGLTYMFLVGRLRTFFKLIFVWIPQTILIAWFVNITGLEEIYIWVFLILVAFINFFIFSVHLHDKHVKNSEWATNHIYRIKDEDIDSSNYSADYWSNIFDYFKIFLLGAISIFLIGGVIGLAYFGWQQLL
jgi:hypothetical protein